MYEQWGGAASALLNRGTTGVFIHSCPASNIYSSSQKAQMRYNVRCVAHVCTDKSLISIAQHAEDYSGHLGAHCRRVL